jgi:hypothetical protein
MPRSLETSSRPIDTCHATGRVRPLLDWDGEYSLRIATE